MADEVVLFDCHVAIDRSLLNGHVVSNGILNVALMNQPQPRDKLSRVTPSKPGELLVDRQARLLNDIRIVDSSLQLGRELLSRNSPQEVSVQVEQSSRRAVVPLTSERNERGNFRICCGHDAVSYCDNRPSTNEQVNSCDILFGDETF